MTDLPPDLPPDLPIDIERIDAITRNARQTWFGLLGVLVFTTVTLMRFQHIDFYGVDRATKLPLGDVSVPTRYFFIAAPILITAIYGYFHLYLIRLWDALGRAEPAQDGRTLGDMISPWLVSDAALHLRDRKRHDGCTTPRALDGPAMALNLALAWVFGLLVLAALWWQSMTAREFWMSCIACLCFVSSVAVATESWLSMQNRMSQKDPEPTKMGLPRLVMILGLYLMIICTHIRTTEPQFGVPIPLARIDLTNEAIVERPAGWLPYDVARDEYRDAWCKRKGFSDCIYDFGPDRQAAFEPDWRARRLAVLSDMARPIWHKYRTPEDKPDFRHAVLSKAFLAGANFSEARLDGAVLIGTRLESANLKGAALAGADLRLARLETANLREAQLEGADLWEAQLEDAILSGAQMQGANLSWAHMQGADLSGGLLQRANLSGADLTETNLNGAQMQGANLSGAEMYGTNLNGARMHGANLSGAFLTGDEQQPMTFIATDLSASINTGGALRFADLGSAVYDEKPDFRNAFLDASVYVPASFRAQMGRPCQWVASKLTDQEFFTLWRWWVEQKLQALNIPKILEDTPPATAALLAQYNLTDCDPSPGALPQ